MTYNGSIKLVRPDGSTYQYKAGREPLTPQMGARSNRASASPQPTWCWIPCARRSRSPSSHRLGRNARLPRISLGTWFWRGRGDGHGPARDGSRLAFGIGTHQTHYSGRKRASALLASGAGTDHLPCDKALALRDVANAYLEQCEAIEAVGGRIILMASRALAAVGRHADDYASVYATVLAQVRQPVILHWLGPMFDPALEGYWGAVDIPIAAENCLNIIRANREKIDGIKISLLDADLEVSMRRQLPPECGCIPATTSITTV